MDAPKQRIVDRTDPTLLDKIPSPATAPATQLVEWTSADGKVPKVVPPGVRYALDAKYRGQKFGDTALAIFGFFDEKAILEPMQHKMDGGSPHDPHELPLAVFIARDFLMGLLADRRPTTQSAARLQNLPYYALTFPCTKPTSAVVPSRFSGSALFACLPQHTATSVRSSRTFGLAAPRAARALLLTQPVRRHTFLRSSSIAFCSASATTGPAS